MAVLKIALFFLSLPEGCAEKNAAHLINAFPRNGCKVTRIVGSSAADSFLRKSIF